MQRTKNLKKKWKKLKKLVKQNKDTLILQQTSSNSKKLKEKPKHIESISKRTNEKPKLIET